MSLVTFCTYIYDLVGRLKSVFLIKTLLSMIIFIGSLGPTYNLHAQRPQEPKYQQDKQVKDESTDRQVNLSAGCLKISAIEREAKVAFYTQKRNRARTLAEKALNEQARPILGAMILAQVYEESEGNFPKALYWIREATDWLVKACGTRPTAAAKQMHKDLLIKESFILGDMDQREEQLNALNRFDQIYKPPRDELKIWPLVKLGRFEEARSIGLKQIQSENQFVRSRAFNGMMAIECEARNRQASYEWGMKGHIDAREQSCVIALNMGLASRQCFKFDEEERFNRIALKAEDRDCSSSPFIQSSATYLIRGEFQKSISALSSWAPSTAMEWMQSHMRVKARRAELMYGLGVWRRGLKEIHDVVTYPDRAAGTDSASEEMLNLESYMLYWALLEGERIASAERRAIRGLSAWLKAQPKRILDAWKQWKIKRQIIRFATYHVNLIDLIKPYFSSVMPWYSSLLVYVLGEGVIKAALDQARNEEAQDYPKIANAYLDGYEAELSWKQGDYERCLLLVEQALKTVPKSAKLFRYRLIALRWAARYAEADEAVHDDDLHLLLSEYPLPLRLLDLKLPVRMRTSGGQYGQAVLEALERSPRFSLDENAALSLQVIEDAQRIKICLLGRQGNRYRCAETFTDFEVEKKALKQKRRQMRGQAHAIQKTKESSEGENSKDLQEDPWALVLEKNPVWRIVDRAHQELFSPQVELTQKEMDTLDGNIRQLKASDAVESLFP
ncbi:MAG: hypothetical protein CMH49_10045 [Myxococcales bacterium]|nr:hypothetical protein [Myxococcales bacterium]